MNTSCAVHDPVPTFEYNITLSALYPKFTEAPLKPHVLVDNPVLLAASVIVPIGVPPVNSVLVVLEISHALNP